MGTMTRLDFTNELNFLLGNRNDSDATDTTRVQRWIQQAYTYICHPSVHHFREMQAISNATTLVTADNDYSITTLGSDTVVAIRFVTHIEATSYTALATKRKVNPRGMRWFESRTLASGRPFNYAVDGEQLFVSGVPSSTENGQILRIGYYKEPMALAADGTVTALPTYYDRPLMKFIQAFAEADLGERALALVTLKEAVQLLNNATAETEMEGEDTGFHTEFILHPAMGF
ncbi:hypothetical protein LCGC14_2449200 [marine sediment metagenome]|uniref:Uncharacterized protein n=1 Tax=marine sediment metagenome TaxID=412755 RepID=A0A0F9DTQ3_9ZZZZ